jgi:hypothetical protein
VVEAVTKSRAERAAALEEWSERVQTKELRVADTEALRVIAELADQRERVDSELIVAVRAARAAHRSWSEIGAMLGVSKQAAQRKYGHRMSA